MPRQQGFGCMGFSAFYTSSKTATPEQAKAVIEHAVSKGVVVLNTATFYGPLTTEGFGANLRLLKTAIQDIDRSKIQLMVKIGMDTRAPVDKPGTKWEMKGDAASLIADVDFALESLGTSYIDIIVLCRVPKDVPIQESVAAMKSIVESGKARHIALSEASAATIRAAHAIHPIYAIEQEWSLWARDIEAEIIPTVKELGIKVVAYSPLGRGFLTGSIRSREDPNLDPNDYRLKASPKFEEENLAINVKLLEAVQPIADRKGITVGQLSLAWLHAQGDFVIPIPGTTSISHLEQNLKALEVELSVDEIEEINRIFDPSAVAGLRYPHNHMTFHAN